jgi:limonene-1,2-epoxide hydrolase
MTDACTEKDTVVARNEKVVRRFIDAWAALDVEAAAACLTPNIVYINQPLEPVVGLVNVRKIIQGILDRTKKVEWKLFNVFGRGNTICTERLDCWDFVVSSCRASECSISTPMAKFAVGAITSTISSGSKTAVQGCISDVRAGALPRKMPMRSVDPIVERNEKAVREFIRGWETRDLALAMAQVTDDMCYLNQPLEAIRGRSFRYKAKRRKYYLKSKHPRASAQNA